MTELAQDSAAAYATALLGHYGFELGGYTAQELVAMWLDRYRANWVRLAAIEALYQGRYKAVSVGQILATWTRRGRPIYHFNHEFERLISHKIPQNIAASPDAPSVIQSDTYELAQVLSEPPEEARERGSHGDLSGGGVAPRADSGSVSAVNHAIIHSNRSPESTLPAGWGKVTPRKLSIPSGLSPGTIPRDEQSMSSRISEGYGRTSSRIPVSLEREVSTVLAEDIGVGSTAPTAATTVSLDIAGTPVNPDDTDGDSLTEPIADVSPEKADAPSSSHPDTYVKEGEPEVARGKRERVIYEADWGRWDASKRPIHQFMPTADKSEFYLKLKAVADCPRGSAEGNRHEDFLDEPATKGTDRPQRD